jgi:hypothetical protein
MTYTAGCSKPGCFVVGLVASIYLCLAWWQAWTLPLKRGHNVVIKLSECGRRLLSSYFRNPTYGAWCVVRVLSRGLFWIIVNHRGVPTSVNNGVSLLS